MDLVRLIDKGREEFRSPETHEYYRDSALTIGEEREPSQPSQLHNFLSNRERCDLYPTF